MLVIKHWRLNNYLRNDRHVQTTYTEELDTLGIDDKGAYTQNVEKMERLPVGIPNDNQVVGSRYTQDRIGKDSIDNNIYSRAEDSPTEHPEQADVTEIVKYLNQAAGTSYKPNTPKTVRSIKARMKEGFTVDNFKTVIDKKVSEWAKTDMQKYLRPETLFGTKFEGYLNQQIVKGKAPPGSFNRIESRNYSKADFAEFERIALGGEQ